MTALPIPSEAQYNTACESRDVLEDMAALLKCRPDEVPAAIRMLQAEIEVLRIIRDTGVVPSADEIMSWPLPKKRRKALRRLLHPTATQPRAPIR